MNTDLPTSCPSIITDLSVTVVFKGKPYIVGNSDPRYHTVKAAVLAGEWEKVYRSLDIISAIKDFTQGDISVIGGEVFYKGKERLHNTAVDKLLELLKAGLKDAKPLTKYLARLLQNPSRSSVQELYDFQSYKSLPIDQDGYVIAYKGVNADGWSCRGNKRTVVLQGKTNAAGQILNTVGSTIEVERRCVDDDRRNSCSHGLHVGSWDYASTWGQKTLMVRFDPKDAVSVPTDCACQKLRVSKYEILAEVSREDTRPYIDDWKQDETGKGESHRVVENAGWKNPRDSKGRFTSRSRKVSIQ